MLRLVRSDPAPTLGESSKRAMRKLVFEGEIGTFTHCMITIQRPDLLDDGKQLSDAQEQMKRAVAELHERLV